MTFLDVRPDLTARTALIRAGRVRRSRRRVIVISALAILLLLLIAAAIMLGNTIYPVSDVLAVMRGLLMDFDATGDADRVDRAFHEFLRTALA